ncbi:MAG: cellulase family glycosylhydrolase [Pirellulales bacterium]
MVGRQTIRFIPIACALAVCVGLALRSETPCRAAIRYTGVNLSGAEFGVGSLPGTYGTHYTYPTTAEINYFVGKGMNTFRLPIRWERLQRSQLATLHGDGPGPTGELDRLDTFVNTATGQGAYVIIEPHNFARYFPSGSGDFQTSSAGRLGGDVPDASFADFWGKVADHYKGNERVIFNLMNEPTAIDTDDWVAAANAAIAAIRATGAKNLIQVPGNRWTGAWAWNSPGGSINGISLGRSNASALLDIVDPGHNFVIEAHQYLDSDGSGSHESINNNDPMTGVDRIKTFTNWLRANGLKGFLGEFAVPNSLVGAGMGDEAINNLLDYMEANSDVWTGWAWWGGGPWWAGGPGQPPGQTPYMFLLDPANLGQASQTDKAAMAVLQPHFADLVRGDFNFDGAVDAADYTVWRDSFGQTGAGLDADGNIDGIVDELDLNLWAANFDAAPGGGSLARAAVPEPAGLWLLAIGGMIAGAGARQRSLRRCWR